MHSQSLPFSPLSSDGVERVKVMDTLCSNWTANGLKNKRFQNCLKNDGHPFYAEKYHYRPEGSPPALDACVRVLTIPSKPRLSGQDVDDITETVRTTVKENLA